MISFHSVNGFLVLHRNVAVFLWLRTPLCVIKGNGSLVVESGLTFMLFWEKAGGAFLLSPFFPSFLLFFSFFPSFLCSFFPFFHSFSFSLFLSISHIPSSSDNYYSNITDKIFVSENIFIYNCQTCFNKSTTILPVFHVRHHGPGAALFGRSTWT